MLWVWKLFRYFNSYIYVRRYMYNGLLNIMFLIIIPNYTHTCFVYITEFCKLRKRFLQQNNTFPTRLCKLFDSFLKIFCKQIGNCSLIVGNFALIQILKKQYRVCWFDWNFHFILIFHKMINLLINPVVDSKIWCTRGV